MIRLDAISSNTRPKLNHGRATMPTDKVPQGIRLVQDSDRSGKFS